MASLRRKLVVHIYIEVKRNLIKSYSAFVECEADKNHNSNKGKPKNIKIDLLIIYVITF